MVGAQRHLTVLHVKTKPEFEVIITQDRRKIAQCLKGQVVFPKVKISIGNDVICGFKKAGLGNDIPVAGSVFGSA